MNDIIQAIADILYGLYPEYKIYIQDTEQGLIEPCFIIKRIEGSQRERLGDQVILDEVYSVSFLFSQNIRTLREVTNNVELNLRFLYPKNNKPIITHNRRSAIVDDSTSVITFEISSNFLFKAEDLPRMEAINHGVIINE